jgi:hypothetical protein
MNENEIKIASLSSLLDFAVEIARGAGDITCVTFIA